MAEGESSWKIRQVDLSPHPAASSDSLIWQ
jgi:hypothetical protein